MIEIDLRIRHHFTEGVYAKEMHLPAGHAARSHKHVFDHISMLSEGVAVVEVDGVATEYSAPAFILIKAHAEHQITAIKDLTWFCVHQTSETDPDKIDMDVTE